jgi:hypothetical protein
MSTNAFILFVQTICHAIIAGLNKSFPSVVHPKVQSVGRLFETKYALCYFCGRPKRNWIFFFVFE